MILATGWAGFTSSVRELEKTETMGKIKSGTVTMIDRSMDGLSKVNHAQGEFEFYAMFPRLALALG